MGLMRFIVSAPDRITEAILQQAYISGINGSVWPVQASFGNRELLIEQAVPDSGKLQIPWEVEGHPEVTLSTGSLRQRPQPYHLPLELARGTIARLRNQLAEWQMIGLLRAEAVTGKLSEAMACFSQAVLGGFDPGRSAELAEEALRLAMDAAGELVGCYTEQVMAARRCGSEKPAAFLGADLGASPLDDSTAGAFLQTFNAAGVPLVWRQVETSQRDYHWEICDEQIKWCQANGLRVCAGPLLQMDPQSLPDWLDQYQGDFDDLLSCVSTFVQAVVSRYRGHVDLWQSAGRIASSDVLGLSGRQKLWLASQAIQLTRWIDPDTPLTVSLDQPWAEYMSRRQTDFPPLELAEALLRADLGLTGLVLEINMGYHPGGTLPRDPMEISRQLDVWSQLGVPLYVALCVPSGDQADSLALRQTGPVPGGCSPRSQRAWAERCVGLLLAKPYVGGVIWRQLHDAEPHDFPHGGLFDVNRRPKPVLEALASSRAAYLEWPKR